MNVSGQMPAPHGPQTDPALLAARVGTAPITYCYDVPPGHYDVTVVLGSATEVGDTVVFAEAHRLMVERVQTDAGELVRRTFTVNVRNPHGQQNAFGGRGTPGLTLIFDGSHPQVSGIGLAANPEPGMRLFLVGDSTVTDQDQPPYTGWGQRLPWRFGVGLSVINHSGSGESTQSMLAQPQMWATLRPQLRSGDLVLIQLAHNDKETRAEQYRDNLGQMLDEVRAGGGTPALVTPIVRLWFDGDHLSTTGMIVNELGIDLPATMRSVAAERGTPLIDLTALSAELVEGLGPGEARPIYLVDERDDRTHTSAQGADVYSGLVAGELRRLGLVPERYWNDY